MITEPIIINKKHKDIKTKFNAKVSTITFSGNHRISFTGHAAEMCKLYVGNYLHFVLIDKLWCFYTDSNDDGFKLFMVDKAKQSGVCISSYPASRMFASLTGFKGQVKFYVQGRGSELNGHKLYEILTHKPISQIGKI